MTLSLSTPARLLIIAISLTAVQIALLLLVSGKPTLSESFSNFGHWDSGWYANIAATGYHTTLPPTPQDAGSNVAFLPGYPLLVAFFYHIVRLAIIPALLIPAELAAVGFWLYVLLLLRRWNVSLSLQMIGVALMFSYPSSLFLVLGYSESLFLFCVLGFVYWSDVHDRRGTILTAVHGFFAGLTRLPGFVLAALPLAGAANPSRRRSSMLKIFAVMMGGIAFFAYCAIEFGAWDLYFQTERIGWGTSFNPGALLQASTYLPVLPQMTLVDINPIQVSRLSVSFILAVLIVLLGIDLSQKDLSRRTRLPLYLTAFLFWLIAVASMAGYNHFDSMIRQTLPSYILLTLAGVHLAQHRPSIKKWRLPLTGLLIAFVILCAFIQMLFAYRFLHGEWVA